MRVTRIGRIKRPTLVDYPDAKKVSLLETNMGTTNGIAVRRMVNACTLNESAQLKVWVYDICPDGTFKE